MKKKLRTFIEARKIVQEFGLKSQKEYREWYKRTRSNDIPSNALREYKGKGWTSWGDFLGTGFVATNLRQYPSFEKARNVVRKLGLKSQKEYKDWWRKNKANDLPSQPQKTYKKQGWTSWGDFLGTGFVYAKYRKFKPFEEARQIVRKLGLKTSTEFTELSKEGKIPKDIPAWASRYYKKLGTWTSWGDFLGTGFVYAKYRKIKPFEEAQKIVSKLGFKNLKEYGEWWKKNTPKDLPANPISAYKGKGWISWGHYLGTGSVAPSLKQFKLFEESRKYVHALKFSGKEDYAKWAKSKERPSEIPTSPPRTYKGKGWTSWGDYLGTGTVATQLRQYRTFREFKIFFRKTAIEYGIKNKKEWINFVKNHKLPEDIPALPWIVYSKQNVWRRIKK